MGMRICCHIWSLTWFPSKPLLCVPAGYQWDYVFDWTILKYQQTQSSVQRTIQPAATDALQGAPSSREIRDDRPVGAASFQRSNTQDGLRRR